MLTGGAIDAPAKQAGLKPALGWLALVPPPLPLGEGRGEGWRHVHFAVLFCGLLALTPTLSQRERGLIQRHTVCSVVCVLFQAYFVITTPLSFRIASSAMSCGSGSKSSRKPWVKPKPTVVGRGSSAARVRS